VTLPRSRPAILPNLNDHFMLFYVDVSLRGKLVVYDNQRRQIGWANSDCSKPQTQKGFPFFL
jgi:hypothetical protein